MPTTKKPLPTTTFRSQKHWAEWLEKHHADSPGVWIKIAKKASGIASVTHAEALEVALRYGWIDGQRKANDEATFLQKFTPRGPRSIWSKINKATAEAMIASGQMTPAGLEAVNRAKANGRWDDAYDSVSQSTVPADLQAALDNNPAAKAFFASLSSQNRYAILFRLQTAKKPETRARRLEQFVGMLERGERLY